MAKLTEKEKMNNLESKRIAELKKRRGGDLIIKYNIRTKEYADKLLMQSGGEQLEFRTQTWTKGSGQNFTNADETVFIVEPSNWFKDKFFTQGKDNLIARLFIDFPVSGSHFKHLFHPLGFALVYKKSDDTWVINEMQSDLVSELHKRLKNIKKDNKPISVDELSVRMKANNIHPQRMKSVLGNKEYVDYFTVNYNKINALSNSTPKHIMASKEENDTDTNDESPNSYFNDKKVHEAYSIVKEYVDHWYRYVFQCVWYNAKRANVKHIYMNTSNTVYHGLSEAARKIIYESYPKNLSFTKKKANLRGKMETFWYRNI